MVESSILRRRLLSELVLSSAHCWALEEWRSYAPHHHLIWPFLWTDFSPRYFMDIVLWKMVLASDLFAIKLPSSLCLKAAKQRPCWFRSVFKIFLIKRVLFSAFCIIFGIDKILKNNLNEWDIRYDKYNCSNLFKWPKISCARRNQSLSLLYYFHLHILWYFGPEISLQQYFSSHLSLLPKLV